MDQDGANIQRLTDGGYAVSPSWSPNGGLLTFSWNRKYGPGDPGGQDIYVMDIASKHWLQVTHESGNNDFPSWSPDGRHIVFQRSHRRARRDLVDAGRRHPAAPAHAYAAITSCPTGAGSESRFTQWVRGARCAPDMRISCSIIFSMPEPGGHSHRSPANRLAGCAASRPWGGAAGFDNNVFRNAIGRNGSRSTPPLDEIGFAVDARPKSTAAARVHARFFGPGRLSDSVEGALS